jgi:hypothetical protein
MPGVKRNGSVKRTSGQKKHDVRAAKAMNLVHTGKAKTLKQAWKKV